MMLTPTCHLVFATNFSDACHSAIPAVARWVDQLGCRLTILHVYNPKHTLCREAQTLLDSFFAEADNYPNCDRVLISGDAASGIANYCRDKRDAMLLLPPSDQAGLPRPWHRSLRAQMIAQLPIPIWTLGRTLVGQPMPTASNHLAALVTSPEEGTAHLRQAARYAAANDATLHLLHIVPEVHEGSLTHTLHTAAPLGIGYAETWLSDIAASLEPATKVELHIKQGSARRLLPQLLHRCGADMLLVSRYTACETRFLGPAVNPIFRNISAGILSIPHVTDLAPLSDFSAHAPGFLKAS